MAPPDSNMPGDVAGETHLEHRWGERLRCKARVRLSTGTGFTGAGRIRDISASGAFIETAVELHLDAQLDLFVLGNESARDVVAATATVVRVAGDGVGVEWCRTPTSSICSEFGCKVHCTELKAGE